MNIFIETIALKIIQLIGIICIIVLPIYIIVWIDETICKIMYYLKNRN